MVKDTAFDALWERLEPLLPKKRRNRHVQYAGRKPAEAQRAPLATILTKANRNDITQLLPLLDKIPRVRGQRGRPRHRPDVVQGDRGYDSEPHRVKLKKRG